MRVVYTSARLCVYCLCLCCVDLRKQWGLWVCESRAWKHDFGWQFSLYVSRIVCVCVYAIERVCVYHVECECNLRVCDSATAPPP